ncbi:Dam family site-specific DNA-(adenine-N6)-methyltransferase [Photorhabdus noenieputensis]|nr:Dam family site-specific DNA-(adenine-N6)-methyltransferase [Photorhabdus noenieputensis]MBS9436656.1 Dam family site-specific DNA-(adenine-N6)-methyltransferase [Photorhabdus noenieputensis]MCK3669433.1 Dam family site-specific DNA-(adenine-N6)-methyltransferase [Photorhabdus noenieputensis]
MVNKTILKWAGSKIRIMDKLLPHLPAGQRLVEPFAGSCSVMMNTQYDAYLIADANSDLIDMYQCIKVNCDGFINSAQDWFSYFNSEHGFYCLRALFSSDDKKYKSQIWHASVFLFLNRHCFNGLCRYNSKGEFNVPFGNGKKPYFPEVEILAFAAKSKIASIHCADWREILKMVDFGDVVYCDPPYFTNGVNFTQYCKNGFLHHDHQELATSLKQLNELLGVPVTVSNSIEAKELYADLGFTIHEIEAPRTIAANGNRQPVIEIIATLEASA